MDDLERALRAVLDDPAQMQELRELAGAMGFSAPQPQSVSATAPKAAEPEPEPKPVQAVFQQQPLPEPAAAMLRQAGKMDKKQEALLLALNFCAGSGRKRSTGRCKQRGWQALRVWL